MHDELEMAKKAMDERNLLSALERDEKEKEKELKKQTFHKLDVIVLQIRMQQQLLQRHAVSQTRPWRTPR